MLFFILFYLFYFSVKNVPCGTSIVTCSKSSTLTIGTGSHQEHIQLLKGTDVKVTEEHKRIKVKMDIKLLVSLFEKLDKNQPCLQLPLLFLKIRNEFRLWIPECISG